jgi:protease IV
MGCGTICNSNRDIVKNLMRFFRALWQGITALKNAVGNLLFLIVIVVIATALLTTDSAKISKNSALLLDPAGIVVEQHATINPVNELLYGGGQMREVLLRDLLDVISEAKSDSRISAMVLQLSKLQGLSMGNLEEISDALIDFRESGKPVYAFGPGYTQAEYFLAAHADRIILNKDAFQTFGGVFLTGLGIYPTYYKSALDKLKVDIRVFSAGDYKDAVEPYLNDGMSDLSRESNSAWLQSLWQAYSSAVTEQRNLGENALQTYIDSYSSLLGETENDPARLALEHGLVDDLLSEGEWLTLMQNTIGQSGRSYRKINYADYLLSTRPPIDVPNPARDKIAVITASGTILDGEQPAGSIGSESLARLIQQARWDSKVKGLVVRVNSPGGSASASEKIRHELELTQKTGKPVVVSMSSYAASGGYWIASTANKIFALESTITGSIGTFMLFPTFEETLGEIGIHSDGIGTTALSGAFNPFKTISPILQATLTRSVEHTYDRFLALVSRGRDMSRQEADNIAQGRVWAGKAAVGLGLVDAIGGLEEAIASAAHLAAISDYDVIYLEKTLSPRERIITELMQSSLSVLSSLTANDQRLALVADLVPQHLLDLAIMSRSPGVYVQCLYCAVTP